MLEERRSMRSPGGATDLIIRPARQDDFSAVAGLLAELGRPAVVPADEPAARGVYLRHLSRPDTASMVAEHDGTVIAFLSLEFRDRLNHTTPQAWIPDLIVREAYRGLGAGRALLEAAIEEARRRGSWSVTLESGYHRKEAHRLYEAVGMTDAGKYYLLASRDPRVPGGGPGAVLE